MNNPLQKSPRIALPNTNLLASIFLDLSPPPSFSLSPSLSSPRLLFFSTSTRLTPSRYQLILRRVDDPNSRVSTCLDIPRPIYLLDPASETKFRRERTWSPVSVGLTRHAPLRNSVGHIATEINHFFTARHSSCRDDDDSPIRLHPSRPRRYFPSLDRKRPITSMTTCDIVDHHDHLFPRIFPPPRCSNSLQNDRKIGQTLSSLSHPRVFPQPPPSTFHARICISLATTNYRS